jgi:heme/copper-type cytochrome/quinol oxidase subunit 2
MQARLRVVTTVQFQSWLQSRSAASSP